jgi:hypothetical protein
MALNRFHHNQVNLIGDTTISADYINLIIDGELIEIRDLFFHQANIAYETYTEDVEFPIGQITTIRSYYEEDIDHNHVPSVESILQIMDDNYWSKLTATTQNHIYNITRKNYYHDNSHILNTKKTITNNNTYNITKKNLTINNDDTYVKKNITNEITNNITNNKKFHNYDDTMILNKKQDNSDRRKIFITSHTDYIYIKRIDSDFQAQLNSLEQRIEALENP